jgi:hypothetical protein
MPLTLLFCVKPVLPQRGKLPPPAMVDAPPDVTQLESRSERLEKLREYRRQREAVKEHDFTQGPPDVSGLEGSERLAVLRMYRQFLDAKGGTFGPNASVPATPAGVTHHKRDDMPTPRSMAKIEPAPWLHGNGAKNEPVEPPQSAVAVGSAAGIVSGAHGSLYNYFERPLTARDTSRRPVTMESEPAPPAAISPHSSKLEEAAARVQAMEGAAGTTSTAPGSSAWLGSWLEAETPRHCRRLVTNPQAFTETKQHIFAPELAADEDVAEASRRLAKQQLEQRQRTQEEAHAALSAANEDSTIAGVATSLKPPMTSVCDVAGGEMTKAADDVMPSTVGLSRRATPSGRGGSSSRVQMCRPPRVLARTSPRA